MTAAMRAIAILSDPAGAWTLIERESGDPVYLSRYVALLALVPAVFGFVGACLVGADVPGIGTVRAPLVAGLLAAIFGYALSFATVLMLGFITELLAPLFGGAKDFDSALKLVVYSYTPVWLAGVFLILPGLRFLMLGGFYGAYVLMVGLARLKKSPDAKAPAYALAVTGCAVIVALLAMAAQRAVFPGVGL